MGGLAIKDVAERTGLAPGTIRMWEQRYGFPEPDRTASGYRRYSEEDVAVLLRAVDFREQGLSVTAALVRARSVPERATDRPSIYGAIVAAETAPVRPRWLHKPTLLSISRAIENEALARASSPVCFAAFQREAFYRRVEHRYRRLAEGAAAAGVFADFADTPRPAGAPVELVIDPDDALGNEWAVIVDAPGYAACLIAWEHPDSEGAGGADDAARRFESLWTTDPETVRHTARVAAHLAARCQPEWAERVGNVLADRPLAFERPAPAITALTNRIIGYLDAG
ncbi:MAG TPA: DICT sensory domain-containing protein [Solirubrobacteraceae bacterium]